jgi:hypothetical protein
VTASDETALPQSVALRAVWTVREGLSYELPVRAVLIRSIASSDPEFPLAGLYQMTVPAGTFESTDGRSPITFSDAGRTFQMPFAFQPARRSESRPRRR